MTEYVELPFLPQESPELEGDVEFGPRDETDSGLLARVGLRPLAFALDTLPQIDADSVLGRALAHPMYRVWVIPHTFGVLRVKGLREPTSIVFQCHFKADGRTCSVQGLLPQPEYIQIGTASFGCSLDASGALKPGPTLAQGSLGERSGLQYQVDMQAGGSISFQCMIELPIVSAVGVGSDRAEWCFGPGKRSLLGRDIRCWSLLVLPRGLTELPMSMRLRVTHRLAFFSSLIDTGWSDTVAALEL